MKRLLLLSATLLLALPVFAQDEKEAYCAYIEQQAAAQKIFLRTPGVESGVSQEPISSGIPQAYAGVTNSLSGDFKARQVGRAANVDCALYRATVDAKLRVQFDMVSLQKDILQRRVDLDESAIQQIDALLNGTKPLLTEQNTTVPTIYVLEETKAKVETDIANTRLLIASFVVPSLTATPLRELVDLKQALEVQNQKAQNEVAKEDNWDAQLVLGLHHSAASPFSQRPGGYGGFRLTYNFGSRARDSRLEKAATSYGEYKKSQHDDAAYLALVLKKQVEDSIAVQEGSLVVLRGEEKKIATHIAELPSIDTNAILGFSNQLNLDKLMIGVEIRLAEYRLASLQDYLTKNF